MFCLGEVIFANIRIGSNSSVRSASFSEFFFHLVPSTMFVWQIIFLQILLCFSYNTLEF